MVNKEKLDAAVEFFCQNDFWKKVYEEAPSDECREHFALDFYFSTFWDDAHEDEDFYQMSDEVDDKLKLEDWKYILKYQGNNPGRIRVKNKIKELSGE